MPDDSPFSPELPRDLIVRVARSLYVQHRFIPGQGDDESLPDWEHLAEWQQESWIAEAGDLFHPDELRQPQRQGDRPLIDVRLRRWGALGIVEQDSGSLANREDDVRWFLDLQLNTLGPLDKCELTLTRRPMEPVS